MEFSINKNNLLEELSKANKIIDPKSLNPSLIGILIEVGMDEVVVISTNGSLSYKSTLNTTNSTLEVKEPGKALIKSKYILEMLRRLDDLNVTFTTIENSELKITTKSSEFNVQILDSADYPLIGFKERGIELNLNARELKKAISQTIISIDEWNKKMSLTGMNFRIKKNNLLISTTDMYRISQKKIKLEQRNENEINFTIPYKTVLELPKMIDSNLKDVKVVISDSSATFIFNQTLFQTNLIESQFPIVESVFPLEFNLEIEVDAKNILKTLNRADLQTEDGLYPTMNLIINDQKIIVRAQINEVGNFEEEFIDFKTLKFNGDEIFISFNSKFLTEAIRTFEDSIIIIKLINSTKPLVITKKENDLLQQVILPTYVGE